MAEEILKMEEGTEGQSETEGHVHLNHSRAGILQICKNPAHTAHICHI